MSFSRTHIITLSHYRSRHPIIAYVPGEGYVHLQQAAGIHTGGTEHACHPHVLVAHYRSRHPVIAHVPVSRLCPPLMSSTRYGKGTSSSIRTVRACAWNTQESQSEERRQESLSEERMQESQ